MALNNTYTRQVRANPTAMNPTQHYVEKYDATAELAKNLTKFGTQVADVYAKADYEAAKRDMKEDYTNRALEQKNALNEANAIAEPRMRSAAYEKAMDKINKKYGKNIDSRFAKEYQSMTALDDKETILNLRFRQTQDLQRENRLRAARERDKAAEMAASANPAYAAEIDNRVRADLGGMLNDGSISRYEYDVALEDYNKKRTAASVNNFLDSSPEDWGDDEVNAALDAITANVSDEKEKQQLKDFAKAKIQGLRKQKEYLDTFNQLHSEYDLLNQSAINNLSIAEINRRMPKGASKEYKSLIKSLNGYGKLIQPDETEKVMIKENLYDEIAQITSNAEAKPEDYAKLQNKIYSALSVKAMSVAEGKKVLDQIIMPLNDTWGRQIDKLSTDNFGWFTSDLGMSEVKNYLENNGWLKNTKQIAKRNKKGKNLSTDLKQDAVNNARISVKAYQLYNSNLLKAAQANGLNSVADVVALEDGAQKRALFKNAQDATIRQMANDRFSFLSGMSEQQQPNKVLDGGNLYGNTNNIDNARLGTPVSDTRYKGTAYDAASGKYGLVRADGTIEEVSYEKYKQFGGQK
mgnify:FL=1|nr:MAG TPA: protein of unknown function (DUF5449) [Bacteriophage sp.]